MNNKISVVEIEKELRSGTAEDVYNIMWDALDNMQQWAGRDKFTCIAMAMGYNVVELDNGTKEYYES